MEKPLSEISNPLISIIVPVYNAGKYLSVCLDSICGQTLCELEIIVVDDGSTDNTGRIADQYAEKDSRIRVVHERNGNPGATRNVGLALATGEYVGFIDGDDWIDPEMYRNLYQTAKANESDIAVTGVMVEYMRDKRSVRQQLEDAFTVCEPNQMIGLFFRLKEASLFAYPVNKIYRRELLNNYSIRFPELLPYEDLIFNLEVFRMAKVVSAIPQAPYHYMRRDELSAAGSYSPHYLEACRLSEDAFRSFFNQFSFPSEKAELFLRNKRISDYVGYVIGFYKTNSPLRRRDRVIRMKCDLFENTTLRGDFYLSSPVGFHERMFYFFLKHATPGITDLIYLFLFFLRRHCDPVYRQFRKMVSK